MSLSKRKEISQTWVVVKTQREREQLREGRPRPSRCRTLPARRGSRTSFRVRFPPFFLALAAAGATAALSFACSQYSLRNRSLACGLFRSIPEARGGEETSLTLFTLWNSLSARRALPDPLKRLR